MSRMLRAGLITLGVLSFLDLLTPLLTDGEFPPIEVAWAAAAIGAASLAMVAVAWRRHTWGLVTLIALRMLSGLAAVPAFFAAGVPAGVAALAAGLVAATVVGIALCLAGSRPSRLAVPA